MEMKDILSTAASSMAPTKMFIIYNDLHEKVTPSSYNCKLQIIEQQ